jgi:hypothetical protein
MVEFGFGTGGADGALGIFAQLHLAEGVTIAAEQTVRLARTQI